MPVTDAEVHSYFDSLSNWGRWGSEDQLGALNLIDDIKRREAAAAVRHGIAISCARTLSPVRSEANPQPILHHMTTSGEGSPQEGFGAAADWFGLSFHGYAITHLDAPSHVFWNGKIYNGHSANLIKTASGARVGSVELASDGIISRGVLLDFPRMRGVDYLDPGDAIHRDELEQCIKKSEVEIHAGDILLIYTGRDARARERGVTYPDQHGAPGLHASTLPLLHELDVALIGSDSANDVMPSGIDSIGVPIHAIGMAAMGLWLIDNALLEPLAVACAREKQWTFLFNVAPLRLKNATGSPVNPIAVL